MIRLSGRDQHRPDSDALTDRVMSSLQTPNIIELGPTKLKAEI